MGVAENKATVERAVARWNAHDDAYFEAYADGAIWHGMPPGVPETTEGARGFFTQLWSAIPDARVTVDEVVGEGDRLALRFRLSGTHEGELMGAAGTGNPISVGAIAILRFDEAGKVAERWTQLDQVAFMTQLGLMPQPVEA
jgi:predicted ester cyclase